MFILLIARGSFLTVILLSVLVFLVFIIRINTFFVSFIYGQIRFTVIIKDCLFMFALVIFVGFTSMANSLLKFI